MAIFNSQKIKIHKPIFKKCSKMIKKEKLVPQRLIIIIIFKHNKNKNKMQQNN